ncbi:hypothetical protein EV426DRAFT_601474 [Tirmania nivea]|nr:hypothetical protein EV426DRAFT_601474 [Tirmania nivea]
MLLIFLSTIGSMLWPALCSILRYCRRAKKNESIFWPEIPFLIILRRSVGNTRLSIVPQHPIEWRNASHPLIQIRNSWMMLYAGGDDKE